MLEASQADSISRRGVRANLQRDPLHTFLVAIDGKSN